MPSALRTQPWRRLPKQDWNHRHENRLPDDVPQMTPETARRLMHHYAYAGGDRDRLGRILPWMGSHYLDFDLYPCKTFLVDLRAYYLRQTGPDRTQHQACYSFPTEHRSHVLGPDGNTQFNNSGLRATSQKGSSSLSAARLRMAEFHLSILAAQRSLTWRPSAGIGLTQLQNTVPGGCYAKHRLSVKDLHELLHDVKSACQLRLDRYPAARRLSRHGQRLQFRTGTYTTPGVVLWLDHVTRSYDVARTYRRWYTRLPDDRLQVLATQTKSENYKRSDSMRRVVSHSKSHFLMLRRKNVGGHAKKVAKGIVRHFKQGLKAQRLERLAAVAVDREP